MNKLKKYEQLIAEKLQQLPVPDKEAGWQQMKKLLDEDQPSKKGGVWKWTAMLAVLATIGLWWLAETNKSNSAATVAKLPSAKSNNTSSPSSNQVVNDNNATQSTTNFPATENKSTIPVIDDNHLATGATAASAAGFDALPNNQASTQNKNDNNYNKKPGERVEATGSIDANPLAFDPKIDFTKTKADNKQPSPATGTGREAGTTVNRSKMPVRKTTQDMPTDNTDEPLSSATTSKKTLPLLDNNEKDNALTLKQKGLTADWKERKSIILPGVAITQALFSSNLSVDNREQIQSQLAQTAARQKQKMAQANELEKLAKKTARRDRLNNSLGGIFKPFSLKADGEPWWAVGLSLNNTVATGSQNRYNYNINAKNNLALDFLPSPYVQYHINQQVYLQTELNLSAPQHMPGILVSQQAVALAGSNLQRSMFVQKLYYFNWPFTLHYSPVKNLYLGSGIQFSSMQSGLSLIQETDLNTNRVVNSSVQKFKDDSTAARFRTNEWRWQTGGDYYWNRFTLGMRYNQSFSKLLNKTPAAVNNFNNNSFILYMKYNLFEGRRKENGSGQSMARY